MKFTDILPWYKILTSTLKTKEEPINPERKGSSHRVFVGSSTEGRNLAEQVIVELRRRNLAPLAWFDCFNNSRPPLQELERISISIDGAILVATSDDQAVIRRKKWNQMRDNILYEYGLFSGKIGRSKCGLLVPDQEDFRIPSDFLGVACYEIYRYNSVEAGVLNVVDSLIKSLSKTPMPETASIKGRRLLRLIGWIRDEAFRLVQDWDGRYGREIIYNRLIAVSGFIKDDIESFNLTQEYKDIEEIILAAINSFPKHVGDFNHRRDIERGLYELVEGVRPNLEVWQALLQIMQSKGILQNNCYCDKCSCHKRWRQRIDHRYGYPNDYYYANKFYLDDYNNRCAPFAWAEGVAEATTMFEQIIGNSNPIESLQRWSIQFLSPLNESFIRFERRLHEEIFGPL